MGRVKDHDLHPQDEWDDDEDDVAPLVALVNRTNNDFNGSSRMKSFDEVMVSRGRKGRQQTWRSRSFCWLALQTGVAVVTLGCPIVIYLLYFNSGPPSGLTNTCNSASVQELMERMTEASNLCDSDFTGDCKCQSPLEPALRQRDDAFMEVWNATFDRNKGLVAQFGEEHDVVFFGDSITEHWEGTSKGLPVDAWQEVNNVFRKEFTRIGGGRVDGLALGISGDRCSQLLYRIRNGELPDSLDAKVFWVLIGTNDLGLDDCSADAVAAGNIRIVEELQSRRPNAKIVLNSILPFASRSGERDEELFESRAWQVATRVNQWLECYAGTMENVEFFNATSVFVKEDETGIVAEYFEDTVHPSAAGSLVWAQAIINKLLGLIDG